VAQSFPQPSGRKRWLRTASSRSGAPLAFEVMGEDPQRWSLRRDILRALETTSPDADVVLVTGSPPSVSVLGQCRERVSIYFCMDDFLELPGVSAEMLAPWSESCSAVSTQWS